MQTALPSPFAASLLFGYVGAFMYEGDSPLAERRAAALSLDTALLAELMGRVELRELLDADVVSGTEKQLQHLNPERAARDAEAVADLLRVLGPLTSDEIAARSTASDVGAWLAGLAEARRVLTVSYAGQSWWVAVEDIGRLRDGVGVAVPVGVPAAFTQAAADPLGELIGRYARTHGPFTTAAVAGRFGLGLRVAADVLGRLAADRKLTPGEFVDAAVDTPGNEQWCDSEVLRILQHHSLAALRAQVEPVDTAAYGRFLPAWQQVGAAATAGIDGLAGVIEQARRGAAAGQRGGAAGVRAAGGRLQPGDARRTAGFRRGHLVRARRLGGLPPGRLRAADPDAAAGTRPDRSAPRGAGRPGHRRRLLFRQLAVPASATPNSKRRCGN